MLFSWLMPGRDQESTQVNRLLNPAVKQPVHGAEHRSAAADPACCPGFQRSVAFALGCGVPGRAAELVRSAAALRRGWWLFEGGAPCDGLKAPARDSLARVSARGAR